MDERFTIRPATAADQSFISEMQYEAFFVPPGDDPFPRSILDEPHIRKYHVGFATLAGDTGVIAETDAGRPVGAAWVRLVEGYGFVDAATPELGISIVTELRGTGIGTALLQELLAIAPRCSLSVDIRNPAIHLYERLGFVTVRIEDQYSAVMLRNADQG